MIRINLLPYDLRPIKRTPLPYILSVAVLILAVLGMGAVFLGQSAKIAQTRADLRQKNKQLEELESVVREHNELVEQQEQLQAKILAIQEILADRMIWSKQLHRLAEITPPNVWYSGMRVVHKTRSERQVKRNNEGEIVRNKEGDPQYERVKVKRPFLEISGYVAPDDNNEISVNPLLRSTDEDPEFSQVFDLDTTTFVDTEFNEHRVRKFTFDYLIKTQEAT